MQKKSIVIIDDHPMFREGLKTILRRCSKFVVVGEAGNGVEGLRIVREMKPDIVLMDIVLPDQSGIQLTREIKSFLPETHIMIISMHSQIDYITEALRAGAIGYVAKESAPEKLLRGLGSLSKGEYFLDSPISLEVTKKVIVFTSQDEKITDVAYQDLTPREQEILRLRAEGIPIKKIGEKLFISPKTVENHCNNLMRKLNLHSSIDLVRYAAKFGLIDITQSKH